MSYLYLATPYSKYPGGLEEAWRESCTQAAFLIKKGVKVFAPIAHTHHIALLGGLETLDHELWLDQDESLMEGAMGMIQCRMRGWQDSYGMEWERQWFIARGKPVYPMEPYAMPSWRSLDK